MMLAITVLLFPSIVCFWTVFPFVVLPYVFLAILLLTQSLTANEPMKLVTETSVRVSGSAAAGFGVLGLMSGTIGEAFPIWRCSIFCFQTVFLFFPIG